MFACESDDSNIHNKKYSGHRNTWNRDDMLINILVFLSYWGRWSIYDGSKPEMENNSVCGFHSSSDSLHVYCISILRETLLYFLLPYYYMYLTVGVTGFLFFSYFAHLVFISNIKVCLKKLIFTQRPLDTLF